MNAGDTFQISQDDASPDSHFWMVISDPEQSHFVLIVNFTSWRKDKDLSCVVEIHDHKYLSKKSCVNYPKARIVPIVKLEELRAASLLIPHEPLSPKLLERIRAGAGNSLGMELGNWQFLVEQGVVQD